MGAASFRQQPAQASCHFPPPPPSHSLPPFGAPRHPTTAIDDPILTATRGELGGGGRQGRSVNALHVSSPLQMKACRRAHEVWGRPGGGGGRVASVKMISFCCCLVVLESGFSCDRVASQQLDDADGT